jgi:hypothetical protein
MWCRASRVAARTAPKRAPDQCRASHIEFLARSRVRAAHHVGKRLERRVGGAILVQEGAERTPLAMVPDYFRLLV